MRTKERGIQLAVNIDHVATVREARKTREPEPLSAAMLAELGGAEGITVHLRTDRRHIKDRDVELLRQVVSTKLNVEMAATSGMLLVAKKVTPDQVTLVPELPGEVTTTGGLDVISHATLLKNIVQQFHDAGIRVSLFIDAIPDQVRKSSWVGADAVEINTGPYAEAKLVGHQAILSGIVDAARLAEKHELVVLAGHGLTYVNVKPIAAVREIVELNIGHSIVSRSVMVGMERAVREMVLLVRA